MSGHVDAARPVLGVSVAVFSGSAVLLVKRGKAPLLGLWSLPGGTVEPGEPLREAARREVLEETGLEAIVGPLVDLHEVIGRSAAGSLTHHFVIVVFRAHAEGCPEPASDAAEARFVPLDQLPDLETTPGLAAIVARAAALD
jgi:8-oxo-dGTP diphosphatase